MRLVSACFVLVVLASFAVAQKAKPWTEWTKKDVEKTLNDSAWGQTQSEGGSSSSSSSQSAVTMTMGGRNEERNLSSAARQNESGETKPVNYVKYHVRFLSAKPVRAAFARQVMLAKAEAATEALATQLQGFIDRDFSEYIVISVGIEVGDPKMAPPLMRAFTAATTEALGQNVYLERKDGKKLFLLEYRAPVDDGMGAKFIFKRELDGHPFLSENDNVRFVADLNEKMKLTTRYKLSDMLYDGKLEY